MKRAWNVVYSVTMTLRHKHVRRYWSENTEWHWSFSLIKEKSFSFKEYSWDTLSPNAQQAREWIFSRCFDTSNLSSFRYRFWSKNFVTVQVSTCYSPDWLRLNGRTTLKYFGSVKTRLAILYTLQVWINLIPSVLLIDRQVRWIIQWTRMPTFRDRLSSTQKALSASLGAA